ALPTLLSALESEDPNTRAASIEALSRIGGDEAERALADRLAGSDPFEAMAALDGLERLHARLPYDTLTPLLGDRLLRRGALPLLGRCGDPRAAELLGGALGATSSHLAGATACALLELMGAGADAEQAVCEVARELGPAEREGLLRLLDSQEQPVAVAAARLAILAREGDALGPVSRMAADGLLDAEALAPLRDWGSPCVRRLLRSSEQELGRAAGIALELAAELADESMLPQLRATLRRALSSQDLPRSEAAARGLDVWAEERDATNLVAAARRGDEGLARACAVSLAHLAERSPEAVIRALHGATLEGSFGAAMARVAATLPSAYARALLATGVNATDPRTRRAAVEALGTIDDGTRSSEVSFALMDEDRGVQTAAARSMGARTTRGSEDETAELSAALASPDAGVRAAVAAGIREHADDAIVALLEALTADPNAAVAVEALLALGRLDSPQLERCARACLSHAEPERRKAALRSLAMTGTSDLSGLARRALGDPAWDVRLAAAQVLAGIGGSSAYEALSSRLEEESDETVRTNLEGLLLAGREGGSPDR
ncbi:MAG: hypothetical protein GXP55_13930, partial [Deltaproteobacteria bacterium]|nr:hypothetical protein [Deltaproteobacteria bacterium]